MFFKRPAGQLRGNTEMKYIGRSIIASIALVGIMSVEASAQYVPCGSVFTAPHGRVAGTVGFAARECDPPRQQQRSTRLPYPGGIVIGPRQLGAHAVPLNRPIILGSQQRVIQRSSNTYGVHNTRQAQIAWKPSIDCDSRGGTRTINPNTGKPSCFVPDRR